MYMHSVQTGVQSVYIDLYMYSVSVLGVMKNFSKLFLLTKVLKVFISDENPFRYITPICTCTLQVYGVHVHVHVQHITHHHCHACVYTRNQRQVFQTYALKSCSFLSAPCGSGTVRLRWQHPHLHKVSSLSALVA